MVTDTASAASAKIRIGGRVQTLFSAKVGDADDHEAGFTIPRGRLVISGKIAGNALSFKLQPAIDRGVTVLKDYYLDLHPAVDGPTIRVGQWKRPFSRAYITSTARLDFVDRSITNGAFGNGRDIGIGIHNDFEKNSAIEYVVAVLNGDNADRPPQIGEVQKGPVTDAGMVNKGMVSTTPSGLSPSIVARLAFGGGPWCRGAAYSEGASKSRCDTQTNSSDSLRYHIGAAARVDVDAGPGRSHPFWGTIDFNLMSDNLAITGAIFLRGDATTPKSGIRRTTGSVHSTGGHLQASLALAQQSTIPALRFSAVDDQTEETTKTELIAGISHHTNIAGLKLQADVARLTTEFAHSQRQSEVVFRAQVQLAY